MNNDLSDHLYPSLKPFKDALYYERNELSRAERRLLEREKNKRIKKLKNLRFKVKQEAERLERINKSKGLSD